MSPQEIQEKARGIISEQLGASLEEVTPDMYLVDWERVKNSLTPNGMPNLGADSLDMVELVITFEEKFGIDVSDEYVEKMAKVQDVYGVLEKLLPDPEKSAAKRE